MTLRIEHIALWTRDLERVRAFYERYFGAVSGPMYTDEARGFSSYFISFADGARLELMAMPSIPDSRDDSLIQHTGYIHIAISVGTEDEVWGLTERLRNGGYRIVGEPRKTGDGYFESTVLDPDGNRIEITV
jgi:lactoylglutathione lyase